MKILCIFLFLLNSVAYSVSEVEPAPLVFEGQTLFVFKSRVGSIKPSERVQLISQRLNRLLEDRLFDLNQINVQPTDLYGWEILKGDSLLMVITHEDAKLAERPGDEISQAIAFRLKEIIANDREIKSPKQILLNSIYAGLCTIGLFLILYGMRRFRRYLRKKVSHWSGTLIRPLRINSYDLIPAERVNAILQAIIGTVNFIVTIGILYFFVPLVLSLFPMTAKYSSVLVGYILNPLNKLWLGLVNFIPDLIFIIIAIIVARYFLKMLHVFFSEIEKGHLQFSGFYQEWAEPSYQLVRILTIAFTVVMIFPYIPGSNSPAFQGVTVFLGVLVSFGSSSAISNIIAGLVLTYTRSFRLGDRVKIADTMGDVIERNILITRILTVKNVEITIPNSIVINSHIINFSTSSLSRGLILHTEVTIGYDAPWRKVHQLLIQSAKITPGILENPAPFVLQTGLDDSYVRYEINAYTHQANSMASVYSALRQNIQDAFNTAGVEIMSPSYHAMRDGNKVTIPEVEVPLS